jgi:hypothetical protein
MQTIEFNSLQKLNDRYLTRTIGLRGDFDHGETTDALIDVTFERIRD